MNKWHWGFPSDWVAKADRINEAQYAGRYGWIMRLRIEQYDSSKIVDELAEFRDFKEGILEAIRSAWFHKLGPQHCFIGHRIQEDVLEIEVGIFSSRWFSYQLLQDVGVQIGWSMPLLTKVLSTQSVEEQENQEIAPPSLREASFFIAMALLLAAFAIDILITQILAGFDVRSTVLFVCCSLAIMYIILNRPWKWIKKRS